MINKFLIILACCLFAGSINAMLPNHHCLEFLNVDFGTNDSRIAITEGQEINVTLRLNDSAAAAGCDYVNLRVKIDTDSPQRAVIVGANDDEQAQQSYVKPTEDLVVTVRGVFLGHSSIIVQSWNGSGGRSYKDVKIATLRQRRPRDAIFQGIIFIMIIFGNAGIGLSVNWQELLEVFKRPIGPAIGFCCQYIIMPLTAFAVVKLIDLEPSIALGIFIVGCSPGGGGSNYHTYFLGGNLPLSVAMTIISTIAALAMMPLWIYTLGQLVAAGEVFIDFKGILTSLASSVLPFGLGIFIKWWRPQLADKMFRFGVRPMLVVVFLYLITAGLLTNLYVFKLITPKILLAAVALPYTGFSLGFAIAYVLRQGYSKSITIAIETGIQSAAVAIATLTMSLPQPDADIAVAGPLITTMLTPVPLWIAEISLAVYQCIMRGSCRKNKSKGGEKEGKEIEEATEFTSPKEKNKANEAANSSITVPLMSTPSPDTTATSSDGA